MGRNLYILAATVIVLALVSALLSLTGAAPSAGDAALWRTTALVLFCIGCVVALAGVLSALFEQAERRDAATRMERRRKPLK